jgi:serine/threonine protein kinase
MDSFYKTLASVLNTSPSLAEELVSKYSTANIEFFQTYFDKLPTASFVTNNAKNASVSTTLFIEENNIGSGGLATIKKNRAAPYVYKTGRNMYNSSKRILYLKSLFKEAIIQTLLQTDGKYGKHICKLYKVYRVGTDYAFQMEPLEITLEKYFESAEPDSEPLISKYIVKLLEILKYFRTVYGFNHNDLKLDNVMIDKQGRTLKLIDFGFSSIKFNSIEIGKPLQSKADMQYLFYRLSSYFETKYLEGTPSEFSKLIESMAQLPIETPIQTYIDILQPPTNPKKRRGGHSSRRIIRKSRFQTKRQDNKGGGL